VSTGLRIVLLVALVSVMSWTWVRGERWIRRRPDSVDLFVALWRLLMIAATAVALITAVALWTAQGANQTADEVLADNRAITVRLCRQNREWQQAAISFRTADVRIARSELDDANAELRDSQAAVEDAKADAAQAVESGAADNPFVVRYIERERARADREVERARLRRDDLTDELRRRRVSLAELEALVLDECPPEPPQGDD
jgi:hypothetical protein